MQEGWRQLHDGPCARAESGDRRDTDGEPVFGGADCLPGPCGWPLVVRQLRLGRLRRSQRAQGRRSYRVIVPRLRRAVLLEVVEQTVDARDLLFHCLVPAAHWWDDIVFT